MTTSRLSVLRRALVVLVAIAASFSIVGAASPVQAATTCHRYVSAGGNIQRVINATPNGRTVCLKPGVTYTVSAAVKIVQRSNFTLDGRGATIKARTYWGFPSEIVYVRGGSNIKVRNLWVRGSHDRPGTLVSGNEFQAGVGIVGVQRALVSNVHVRNNRGDGFGIYPYGDTPSRDVVIRDSTAVGTGRQGVGVTHAERVTIIHNRFRAIPWMVLDIEPDPRPNTHSVTNLYFRYNKIYGAIHGQMAAIGGFGPSRNIYIENNRVFAGANHGIWSFSEPRAGFRNTNIVFRNNVGDQKFWADPGWRGVMMLCDTDRAIVTGNTQPTVAGKMPGVSINNSTSVSVSSNVFSGTFARTQTNAYACP